VRQTVKAEAVRAAMAPPGDCGATIKDCVTGYLGETYEQVIPLFRYWGRGDFQSHEPEATTFTAARIAAGAAALRDLVVKAWQASANASVGYPPITVRTVEAGRPPPIGNIYGLE
ncbi:MAG: S1/P1 Nuclease, partial [Caulobacteraceae bacterium]